MFGIPEQFRRAVFLAVLVGCIAFSGLTHRAGGADRLTESRSYDALNRLTALGVLGGEAAAPVFRSFTYAYNDANQRVSATREDGSRWDYGYDALGHLTAAVRRLPGGDLMPGHEFAWAYDALGNRTAGAAGSLATDDSLPDLTATYTPAAPGDRNQYAAVATPGFALATGKAHAAAEVTVNGEPAALRRGEFFAHAVPADTEAGPARVSLAIAATEGGETDTVNRIAAVPPQNAAFRYDADGNLVDDGWRQYTWDAEDRLLSVGLRADRVPPGAPAWRVDYAYDFAGRRVRETDFVRPPDAAPDTVGEWIVARERLFLHDGWKVIGEWDGAGRLWQSYLWGLDLSGTLDGAGGVGGLLAVTRHAGPSPSAHFVAHDGGGNVSLLVDAANGALSASYDYDPFGNLLAMSGPFAEANPYRFSGKRVDAFTGLYDYGFRSYHPVAGRWLSRDPIGESGGFNLYGFVGNDPVNGVDVLGMIDWRDVGWFFRDFGSIGAEVVAQSAKNVGHGLVFGTYDLTHALQGKAAEIGYDIGSNGFYDVWYRFSERVYAEIDWWEDSLSSLSDPCYRKLFGESLWLDAQNNAKSYGTTTGTAALGNLTAAGLLKFGGISFKSPFTTTPVAEAALAESEALVQAEFEFAEQNLSGKLSDWSAPKTPLTVNEQTIAKALEGSTMTSPQGKVSLPAVERYVRRLEAGEVPPPIKVDGNVIVDGNHRYVAGRVFGTEPPTTPGTLSPSQAPRVKPIQETVVDPADWGNK